MRSQIRPLVLLFCTLTMASAADYIGTWKLNIAKSKAVGMALPQEQTSTYTAKGSGYENMTMGKSATGEAIHTMFTYVKDGEEMKATGYPNWDAIVINGGTSSKSTAKLKRQGKIVGSVIRTMAADGKSFTLVGKVTLADGKKATYNYVYDKQ